MKIQEIIKGRKTGKEQFLGEYKTKEKDFLKSIKHYDSIYSRMEYIQATWSEFASDFCRYRIWLDLGYKSLMGWIDAKFALQGEKREIKRIYSRIHYFRTASTRKLSRNSKTELEKTKTLCDKLKFHDLVEIYHYVGKLISKASLENAA